MFYQNKNTLIVNSYDDFKSLKIRDHISKCLIKNDSDDCGYLPVGSLLYPRGDLCLEDGCPVDSIDTYLGHYFGVCGCGNPVDVLKVYWIVLKSHFTNNDDDNSWEISRGYRQKLQALDDAIGFQFYQLVLHVLDEKCFIEHGSSVYGSWLTLTGYAILHDLDILSKEEGWDFEKLIKGDLR